MFRLQVGEGGQLRISTSAFPVTYVNSLRGQKLVAGMGFKVSFQFLRFKSEKGAKSGEIWRRKINVRFLLEEYLLVEIQLMDNLLPVSSEFNCFRI
jgi:hypothetical protein